MKTLIIVSILFVLLGTFVFQLVEKDAGFILVSIGNFTIETSFWFGLLTIFLLALIVYLVIHYSWKFFKKIKLGLGWFASNQHKTAQKKTQTGLLHFLDGNWAQAKKELLTAAKNTETPLVHYLAAARSAQELGQSEESFLLLQQAEKMTSDDNVAVVISLAKMQLQSENYDECLAILARVRGKAASHPVIVDLQKQAYIGKQDWSSLISLLPAVKQHQNITDEELKELEENIYLSLMKSAVAEGEKGNAKAKLQTAWQTVPKYLKKRNRIVGAYAKRLHELNMDDKAETIIREALNKEWSESLVELYGVLNISPEKNPLKIVEGWLKAHPQSAELLRTAGKISIRSKLWGKAKNYLQESLNISEKPETYAILAELLADLGEHQKSNELYQRGLLIKTS